MYAAGIVAGRMTKHNKIGFVIGHAVPNVLASVNAFALGTHSVNAKVRIHLVCSNSWNDPVTEAEATRALIEDGSDVIVSILDSSLSVCLAANKAGVYSVGAAYDLCNQVPATWLTGQAWDYGPLYVKIIREVIKGQWKPGVTAYWFKDNYVKLANFGKSVPSSVRDDALQAVEKTKNGKLIVFKGPLKDRDGKVRLAAGKTANAQWLSQMNFFVDGVEGNLSAK